MFVKTFVIPFYYGSGSAKVRNYCTGSAKAKSYGSGSATLLLICQSLAVADTEPDALWKEHGDIGPWNVLFVYVLFLDGIHPPEICGPFCRHACLPSLPALP